MGITIKKKDTSGAPLSGPLASKGTSYPPAGKEPAVRTALDRMHAGKLTAQQVRKKFGVDDLDALHSWAYRVGSL